MLRRGPGALTTSFSERAPNCRRPWAVRPCVLMYGLGRKMRACRKQRRGRRPPVGGRRWVLRPGRWRFPHAAGETGPARARRRGRVLRLGHRAAPERARLRGQHRGQPLPAHVRPAAGPGHADAHRARARARQAVREGARGWPRLCARRPGAVSRTSRGGASAEVAAAAARGVASAWMPVLCHAPQEGRVRRRAARRAQVGRGVREAHRPARRRRPGL